MMMVEKILFRTLPFVEKSRILWYQTILPCAASEETSTACDDNPDRLELSRLYNEVILVSFLYKTDNGVHL